MATTRTYQDAVRLTDADYRLIRGAADTYREDLLVRLCGEVGLRAAEIPDVRPVDLFRRGDGDGGCFLVVREEGAEGEEAPTREAYVPREVADDLFKYIESNGVERTDPVIDVSTRRVQMLVKEVATSAAETHDRPSFADVSPSTLREFFARRLLRENGVDPAVVFSVGGWERLDSILPDQPSPSREQVVEAFDRLGEESPTGTGGRLATVVEAVDTVGERLSGIGTPEEVPTAVCSSLASTAAYTAAWFTERQPHRDAVSIRASEGADLDRAAEAKLKSLVKQAAQTGTLMVAQQRREAAADGPGRPMLAAVPVAEGETDYGVLVVRATEADAFDQPERRALGDLGRRIGSATTALKRRRLLSGDSVVRLAVTYDDAEAVFVELSAALDCTIDLEGVVPAESGAIVCFVRARAARPGPLLETVQANDTVADARLIRSFETEALLEVVLSEPSPLGIFAAHGGKITDLSAENGRARLVGEFPPGLDVRTVIEAVGESYPSVELRSKQERAEPSESGLAVKRALEDELTDKQRSVLRGAYHAGYFEWPRGSTAEELADSMGVSSPTLHNHLRRAQQKLIGTAIDEE